MCLLRCLLQEVPEIFALDSKTYTLDKDCIAPTLRAASGWEPSTKASSWSLCD